MASSSVVGCLHHGTCPRQAPCRAHLPDVRWVIIAIPSAIGLLLVWSGVAGVINARALQSRGVRTKGTIVGAVRMTGTRTITYNSVVEFTGSDARSHRFELYTGSGVTEDEVEKGKSVDVVYDADNPERAVIAGSEGSIPGSMATATFGLLLLGGLVAMTRSRESAFAVAGSLRWVAFAIAAAVGVGFLASGAVWGARRFLFLRGGVRAEGIVVNHLPAARGGGFMAVFAFKSANGEQHQFAASELTPYKEGALVEVVYAPDDPSRAFVHDFQQFWLGPLAVTLLGLFCAGLAALTWAFVKDVKI